MSRPLSVEIEDIIKRESESSNFNNELVIIKLDGYLDVHKNASIQVDAFTLVLVLGGTLDISINGKEYHVVSNAFLDVLDIHSVQNIQQSSDFRGYHIVMTREFLEEAMQGVRRPPVSSLMSRHSHPVMEINNDQALVLETILLNLIKNTHREGHTFQRDIVKNELRSLFVEILNIIMQGDKTEGIPKNKSKEDIVAQFALLVNRHCKEQHSVSFYADELCVEAKYLSRILKVVNGKTARRWIEQSIVMHAKILLKDPDLTIQQVTDILNFSDQSAFGKFFKKHTGISPLNFRRE